MKRTTRAGLVMLGFGLTVAGLVAPARGAGPTPPASPAAVPEKAVQAVEPAGVPPAEATLGVEFGDQQAESFADLVVPLYAFRSGLLFLNPRISYTDDHAEEFNLGAGGRWLVPGHEVILGANLYYDYRDTALDNQFNQVGFGLECLSRWVDARWNYYLPVSDIESYDTFVTTTYTENRATVDAKNPYASGNSIQQEVVTVDRKVEVTSVSHWRMFEEAMEGYDAEVGALLPIPVIKDYADVKAFVGYYSFSGTLSDNIRGPKARLEIRPLPSLYLDAQVFDDKELYGSTYSVGARVSLPFDIGRLAHGRNPFADVASGFKRPSGPPPLSSRMTDMVVRDLHIRTDASGFEEVTQDRKVLKEQTISRSEDSDTHTLLSDVTFVDDDNRSGVENGTWEHPYRKIQDGVNNVTGDRNVYVLDAQHQYLENVMLNDGLKLWGNGAPIMGAGGHPFGNGVYPIVNGQGYGPAITLANNTVVSGFEITQPSLVPTRSPAVGETDHIDTRLVGVFGANVNDVVVRNNYIHGSGGMTYGVVLESFSQSEFKADVSENRIADVRGPGISVLAQNVTDVDLTLARNTVTGNQSDGLNVLAMGGDTFIARVSGDYSGNEGNGVSLTASGFNVAAGLFIDTRANDNSYNGIDVMLSASDVAGVLFASSADLGRVGTLVDTAAGALSGLLPITLPGDGGSLWAYAMDYAGLNGVPVDGVMQANDNGNNGIAATLASPSVGIAVLLGAETSRNGFGAPAAPSSPAPPLPGSAGTAVNIEAGDAPGVAVAAILRSRAEGNRGSGFEVNVDGDAAAVAVLADTAANRNGGAGVGVDAHSSDGIAAAVALSTDPVVGLAESVADAYLPGGIDLGFIPPYGMVQANDNRLSGICFDVRGEEFALGAVLDAQANHNGFNGIDITAKSWDGTAIGAVLSTRGVKALADQFVDASDIPFGLDAITVHGPVQANDNGANGVMMDVRASDSAFAAVVGVEANGNGWIIPPPHAPGTAFIGGNGIDVNVKSWGNGEALSFVANSTANANTRRGMDVTVKANEGDANAIFANVEASGNASDNISTTVRSADEDAYATFSGVTADGSLNGNGILAALNAADDVGVAITESHVLGNYDGDINLDLYCSTGDNGVWINDTAVTDLTDYFGMPSSIPDEWVHALREGPVTRASLSMTRTCLGGVLVTDTP